MTRYRLFNRTRPLAQPLWVRLCASWWCRLRGLMGRPTLAPDDGLLFVWPRPGRLDTAIHMFGMRFDLAVVWLSTERRVVDVRLAQAWRSVLVPRAPARYVLELHPERYPDFRIGDRLDWQRA